MKFDSLVELRCRVMNNIEPFTSEEIDPNSGHEGCAIQKDVTL